MWDLKVRLLDKPYSTGFLRNQNMIQLWMKNNNNEFQKTVRTLQHSIHPITKTELIGYPELDEFIRQYLIPYNSSLVINWINT